MMGLGNSRRGMKSPPLVIAVLLACVFVLGINYWITSSRCVELQGRVVELEGRMRRAAAERGAVELKKNEFEENLKRQMEQLENIQSMHGSQMQIFHSEKAVLVRNITMKEKIIKSLQDHLKALQLEMEHQKETQALKSTFELAQCSNKMKELNELCEEKLRRATGKRDVITQERQKPEETKISIPPVTLKQDLNQKEAIDGNEIKEVKSNIVPNLTKPLEPSQKEINIDAIIVEENEVKENLDKNVKIVSPKLPIPEKVEENKVENVKEPVNQEDGDNEMTNEEEEEEPKAEDAADIKDANKEMENEEVEREHLLNLEGQQEDQDVNKEAVNQRDAEDQDVQNDYNGDEGNEAEPEADKQAELIDNDQNLKDDKLPNIGNVQSFDQEVEDNDDTILKK
ncbi:Golgi membrane protein 1 [Discoglossus pictus]